jgi:hypothetical protein
MYSVGVYQFKDRFLVHPWNKTTMGLGMATEPYVALPLDTDANVLGKAVLDALAQSGRTIQHPTQWKGLAAPRLKAAGVRSERAFQSGSRYVNVDRQDGGYLVCPSRNGGTRGDEKGHEPLLDRAISLASDSTATEIGAAIREGLAICI